MLGLVAVAAAVYAGRFLEDADLWSGRMIGQTAAFFVVVTVGYIALPGIDEVGDDFPATLPSRVAHIAHASSVQPSASVPRAALRCGNALSACSTA